MQLKKPDIFTDPIGEPDELDSALLADSTSMGSTSNFIGEGAAVPPVESRNRESPSSPPIDFDDGEFMDALTEEKGARPLENPKHEMFTRALFGGVTQVDAYLEAISSTAKRSTAKTEARRLLKRPEIASRLHFLQTKLEGMDVPITRVEAVRACTDIMRNENATPDNKLKAIDRLAKMYKWFDVPLVDPSTKKPDPAYLYEFIKRSQANHQHVA